MRCRQLEQLFHGYNRRALDSLGIDRSISRPCAKVWYRLGSAGRGRTTLKEVELSEWISSRRQVENTNRAIICKTKSEELRNSDIWAVLLHIYIHSHFTAELLVISPGSLLSSKRRNRTAKNELPGRVTRSDFNMNTNIEAAIHPLLFWEDDASIICL